MATLRTVARPKGELKQRGGRTSARLGALTAAQPAGEIMHEGGRRMLHRRQVDVARRLAARACDFEPWVAPVDCLVDRRRRVEWLAVRPHPLVPTFAKEFVRLTDERFAFGAPPPPARQGWWSSRARCRAPSLRPSGRLRTKVSGDASAPSGYPSVNQIGWGQVASNVGQHPSSSSLPVRSWHVSSRSRRATSFQIALPP
jgi:hypothetical protein